MNAEKTRQILEFLEELRRVGENFYGQPLFPRSVARTVTFLASTTPLDLSVTRWQQLREGLAFLVRHFSDGDTRSERAQRFNGPAALAALDRANEMMEAFFETSAIELAAVLSAARSSEPMEPQNDLFYQIRRFDYYMSEVQVLPQGLRKLAQEFARIDARSFDRVVSV